MSAPTPISQDPSDIAYEFLGYSPAAIGTVNKKAAPASHAHPLGKTSSRAVGFGLMQTVGTSQTSAVALLTNALALPVTHTIEGWFTSDAYYNSFGLLSALGSVNFPAPSRALYGITNVQTSPGTNALAWLLPDGTTQVISGTFASGLNHMAISSDGTTMRFFLNGVLDYSAPAQSLPASALFGMVDEASSAAAGAWSFDEWRLSGVCRYTADFTVPTEPFTPDSSTLGLWHMDDAPIGMWASYIATNSNGTPVAPGPFTVTLAASSTWYGYSGALMDSSGNGRDLNIAVVCGGSTGNAPGPVTITAPDSSISSGSGVESFGPGIGVTSLNYQIGDLWLTDTSGNPFPVVPVANEPSQIQLALGSSPWESVPFWLGRVD